MAELNQPVQNMASIVVVPRLAPEPLSHCYMFIIVSCVYIQILYLNLIKLRREGKGDDKPHQRVCDFRVFQVGGIL